MWLKNTLAMIFFVSIFSLFLKNEDSSLNLKNLVSLFLILGIPN